MPTTRVPGVNVINAESKVTSQSSFNSVSSSKIAGRIFMRGRITNLKTEILDINNSFKKRKKSEITAQILKRYKRWLKNRRINITRSRPTKKPIANPVGEKEFVMNIQTPARKKLSKICKAIVIYSFNTASI